MSNKWDPFADSFRIVERFGGRFRDFPGDAAEAMSGEDEDGAATPAADVFEDREGLHIEIELPGINPRDVAVTISSGSIIVEAERTFTRLNSKSVVSLEGRYGRMKRAFALPLRAQPEKALAEVKFGVLRIFVPRQQESASITSRLELRGEEASQSVAIG